VESAADFFVWEKERERKRERERERERDRKRERERVTHVKNNDTFDTSN
jgi:hypothetical protein